MRLICSKKILLPVILAVNLIFSGCNLAKADSADLAAIPEYTGSAYTVLNDNIPDFPEEDFTEESFETYSDLDSLGRCGVAYANIGEDLMPTTKRGSIGQIKPSGWHTVKYDSVDGKYLYNRCHLIGYQLTAENANEKNLITGTRYLNTEGMLPFENMVADYIKETGNHVLYRVTPLFDGNNLVATGVQMEAESVSVSEFVLNTSSKKFHKPSCSSISKIKQENKEVYKGSRDALISQGYDPCKKCNP